MSRPEKNEKSNLSSWTTSSRTNQEFYSWMEDASSTKLKIKSNIWGVFKANTH